MSVRSPRGTWLSFVCVRLKDTDGGGAGILRHFRLAIRLSELLPLLPAYRLLVDVHTITIPSIEVFAGSVGTLYLSTLPTCEMKISANQPTRYGYYCGSCRVQERQLHE